MYIKRCYIELKYIELINQVNDSYLVDLRMCVRMEKRSNPFEKGLGNVKGKI